MRKTLTLKTSTSASRVAEEQHLTEKNRTHSKLTSKALYEIWPGKNMICCHGFLFFGPASDIIFLFIGWLIVILSGITFVLCIAPHIWINMSPAIIIAGAVLWLFVVYYYLRACLTEPGIIPRNHIVLSLTKKNPLYNIQRDLAIKKESINNPFVRNITKSVNNEGKWCATCHIDRPPLSTHCTRCDNCVSIWDHHCNFIANCVGQRNHRYFVLFNVCALMCSIFFSCCTIIVFVQIKEITTSFQHLGIMILLFSMPICACIELDMSCLHWDLVASGQTLKMRERQGNLVNEPCVCSRKRWYDFFWFLCKYTSRPSIIRMHALVELSPHKKQKKQKQWKKKYEKICNPHENIWSPSSVMELPIQN